MIGGVDTMPLDGGFLGEAIRLRPSASYCARPVKNRNGDFMGILFGSEGDISSEDLDTLVTKVRNGQGSGNPEDETPCYFGWATFYAVNPTVTKGYQTIGSSATEAWSFVRDLVPSGSTPKDFYSFLFNYGHKMNRARDEDAFDGKSAYTNLKNGSFETLFYACSYGGPLSS